MDDAILAGIRIVDMSRGIAGPIAAMLLAEAGAEVIKVEPPEGDPDRGQASFAVRNRSKKSVVLDPATESERLDRLLGSVDVLVHSFTPREAKPLGLDDAALAARHPHLIVAGVTGWPQGHPSQNVPVRDTLVLAESGYLDEQQPQARPDGPTYLRLPAGSLLSTHLLTQAVLARLINRDRGGGVGPANTSLVQGALLSSGQFQWQRAERPTPGLSSLPKTLLTSIFECADGVWIHIMGTVNHTPLVAAESLERLGPEEVERINAEEQGTRWNMFPNWGAVKRILKTRPHQEWVEDMRALDVAVQPVVPMGKIYFDEQAAANDYVISVDDPVWGKTRQPGTPFTTTPQSRVKGAAPVLGAHTDEVMGGLEPRPAPAVMARKANLPPLHGVKILDMGGALAGPLGPMLLAQLGAEVIKLEPIEGDNMRRLENCFAGCQRGKRSIAVQLKDPASRPIVERLVKWADVVHHNMRLPAAKRLGIDYETLKPLNPKMIYCHVSGYGPKGPRKDWPGMDQMYQSSCGWEYEAAGEANPPMWHRSAFCDHLAAMASVDAVLLAMYRRDRTGEGQQVFSSLLGAVLLTLENIVDGQGRLTPLPKLDHLQYGISPFDRLYPCKDGLIAICEYDLKNRQAILDDIGVSSPDELADAIAMRSVSEAMLRLGEEGRGVVPVGLGQRDALFDSPGNKAVDLVVTRNHAVYGKFEEVGALWNMGEMPLDIELPAPCIGEHSRRILADLQFTLAEIETLVQGNTVLAPDTPIAISAGPERVRIRTPVPAQP